MVLVLAKIILIPFMKKTISKVGFRLRALRRSRHWTQEYMADACQTHGFAVSRTQLARYEIGYTDVPARLIPIFAHLLKAEITDLLPPIGGKLDAQHSSVRTNARNLAGQQIRGFRRRRKWSQEKLARTIQGMGVPVTRGIIANLESQRTRAKDYQLVFLAKALQIPLNWLFPNSTSSVALVPVLNRNSSSGNTLPKPRNKTQLNLGTFTRVARKISRLAKRFIARR
jgi:transcriptional regulator with XRE-family HTH domain